MDKIGWLRSVLTTFALIVWIGSPMQIQTDSMKEVPSSFTSTSELSHWQTYISPLLGYSFEYSEDKWILSEETVMDEAKSFISLSSTDSDDIITIAAMNNPNRLDTSEWVAQSLSVYNENLVEIQEDVEIHFAGHEAKLITQPESCNSVALMDAVFTVDNIAFEIGYLADDVEKISAYQQILVSFRLPDTPNKKNVISQLSLPAPKESICPQQVMQTTNAQRCPDAPFYIPTEGYVMASYGCWGITWCPYEQPDPHKGIDIGPVGDNMWGNGVPGEIDVYAPADGKVVYVSKPTAYGLKLRHSAYNVDTYFTHMANNSTGESYIYVSEGQEVSAGQLLGKMGNYGCYETHLHFNIMVVRGSDLNWSHSKDPTPYLRAEDLVYYNGWDRHPMECIDSIDSIPPTTSGSLSGASGDNGWYTSDVQVTLNASDNSGGSGVKITQYKIDGGAWQTYNGPISVSGDGRHTVAYRSQDNEDNWESAKQVSFPIDATAPIGSLALNDGATSTPGVLVRINPAASDATSGLHQMRLRDAGNTWSAWQAYSSQALWQLPALTGQSHIVEIQIKDVAGNISTIYQDAILLNIYPERPASAGYRLARSTWGAAPKDGQSATYRLRGTVGQLSLIGVSSSAGYRLASGYWSGQGQAETTHRIYLPLVVRQ